MEKYTHADELMDYGSYHKERTPRNKSHFGVGILVMLLAVAGVVSIIGMTVHFAKIRSEEKKQEEINVWNSFLIPVTAVNPSTFDDVMNAPMSEMIEVSVWSIIGSDLDPEKYDYSSGELAVPASEVEQSYLNYFGTQKPIEHQTVEGYGYKFTYSSDNSCYYIPLTGISPVYTPSVVSAVEKNGMTVITCGLVASGAWQQDYSTGKMVSPDPDNYITVTIRQQAGGKYISAIQSAGKPETAE